LFFSERAYQGGYRCDKLLLIAVMINITPVGIELDQALIIQQRDGCPFFIFCGRSWSRTCTIGSSNRCSTIGAIRPLLTRRDLNPEPPH
jgi:hypothetical protein